MWALKTQYRPMSRTRSKKARIKEVIRRRSLRLILVHLAISGKDISLYINLSLLLYFFHGRVHVRYCAPFPWKPPKIGLYSEWPLFRCLFDIWKEAAILIPLAAFWRGVIGREPCTCTLFHHSPKRKVLQTLYLSVKCVCLFCFFAKSSIKKNVI